MSSISLATFSIALFIGSAVASISPARAPSASVTAPTPSSPSPSLSVVVPPVLPASPSTITVPLSSEQIGSSPPSPSTTSIAGFAPAPAPNDSIFNEVAVGSIAVGFLAVALSV